MQAPPQSSAAARKVWLTIRFLFFGIGGFWIAMLFSLDLFERVLTHHPSIIGLPIPVPVVAALILIGSLMMLFAVGEWGRWAYMLVFLSIPISIGLLFLWPTRVSNSKVLAVLVVVLAPIVCNVGVRAYYRWRGRE